jgi:hypothetical protein
MNIEEQREKIGPWMPAVACGVFTAIVMIGSILSAASGGGANVGYIWGMGMLPYFFFLVSQYLVKLKKEIAELREQLDAADRRCDSNITPS